MALVNWNPVSAANFSESNALRLAAQQQLAGGIKGIGDTAVAFNDATGKANTDILLNSLVGQRTPEAAMAAIQAAKAQAGGMYNNYDQAAFRSAAEALPKSAADAQELDFQTADKPYLQAAVLAYSKKDPEAVAHFASQVRSNAGRAELSKLIGDSHTMGVQDAGVLNAEGTLKEQIRNNKEKEKIDWFEARKKKTGDSSFLTMLGGIRQQFKTAADKASVAAVTKTQNTPESNLAYQNAMNGKDGDRIRTWGNVSGKHVDKVLTESSPAYAAAGSALRAKILDHIWAANTAQTSDGMFGGMFQSDLSDEQIKTIGATALADFAANDKVNLTMEQEKIIENGVAKIQLEGLRDGHLVTDAEAREMLIPTLNEQPAAAPPKPKEDPKAAEQYLKDKAELAAREAKRQAALAAGKGNPTSAADTLLNVGKSVKAGINSIPSVIKTGFNAVVPVKYQAHPEDPEAAKAYASIEAKLEAAEIRRYTDALFAEVRANEAAKVKLKSQLSKSVVPSTQTAPTPKAKSVSVTPPPVVKPVETNQVGIEQALPPDLVREAPAATVLKSSVKQTKTGSAPIATTTTSVPEAASKIVASNTSKPSNTSFVDNNFALVAAAQAKAKVPTPVTPAVIKTTVRQDVKGTTPIAKSSQSGTWETMFKKVADKANEVISGKGWSNDPKNQDQYENGLVVDGESTQPSPKHEISIMGMWDKDNNVRSQFLGDYDTFKGYAVNVKVKGGEEYMIPLTYDEIATHTGASREDILSASTNDIRSNAVVQRRVYRTALDKLNTQLSNSKGK